MSSGPHKPPRTPDWRRDLPTRSQIEEDQERRARRDALPEPGEWRRRFPVILLATGLLLAAVITIAAFRSGREGELAGAGQNASEREGEVESSAPSVIGAIAAVAERPRIAVAQPPTAPAGQPSGSLAGTVIAIDPGHASNPDLGSEPTGPGSGETKVKDPGGTSGAATGTPEHVITLAISLKLKQLLEAEGATVVMTRETDVYNGGNAERAMTANDAGARLMVRVHCDGSQDTSRNGISTLYPSFIPGWTDDIQAESRRAATEIQSAAAAATGAADNGIVERGDMTGFNWSDVPSVLVETGFLSNSTEDVKLNSAEYQQQVAQGLLNGIKAYLGAV